MVYVTGDTHARFNERFRTKAFPDQKEMTRDDTVIILGDFGGVWSDSEEEKYWLKWLNNKPFTTVFVDGNHENFDRYYGNEFPVVDFHGGKAHKIRSHIYHLMRGYIFDFEGKSFFAFGGAQSHDIQDGILDINNYKTADEFEKDYFFYRYCGKSFRVNHVSWWKEELPSEEEMAFGRKMLEEHENKVDYVITHCCPHDVALMLGFREGDVETAYFNDLAREIQFDKWYFGHYHVNQTIFGRFNCLYEKIERII